MINKLISFRFSEDIKLFNQIAKFDYTDFGLIMILPILCFYGDDENDDNCDLIFQTTFEVPIKNISEIKKYDKTLHYYDVDGFFNKFFPESNFLKFLYIKSEQWVSKVSPMPVAIHKKEEYVCGTEFIILARGSENSFGGNFIQNGLQGCHLMYGVNEHCKPFTKFAYEPYISSYNIPYDFQHTLKKYVGKNKTTFEIILESYGLGVALDIFKRELTRADILYSIEENHCPFKITLSGNDDESWTRYFCTEAEMMSEVYRLRRCQPINKEIDVTNNNYRYTN